MKTDTTSGVLRVLTVRQPWAGAIVHLGKDIENRTQRWAYRGPVLIHAGEHRPSDAENDQVAEIMGWPEGHLAGNAWDHGQIIGITEIVDCLTTDDSYGFANDLGVWFTGPYGYVLRNTQALTPTPYKGGLGLRKFRFTEDDAWSWRHDEIDAALQRTGYTSSNVDDGAGMCRWAWERSAS